jgi:uncharacterized protein (DUF433 family)
LRKTAANPIQSSLSASQTFGLWDAISGAMRHIDWTECALIETVPGRVDGQPVLRGTRLRPQDLLINRDEGIDWLSRNHGVAPETIRELFAFYDAHKAALVPHPS